MTQADLAPGHILGRYELLAPIAKGGMAQVWAARLHGTRGFQRIVALKTILSATMDNARVEQMFLEEASLASRIQHPNIVSTVDLGEKDGLLYLVMEWVDGEPLTAILEVAQRSQPMPLAVAVNLIGQVCKGLHYAHELCDEQGTPLGLVHRDVSPHNVLVSYAGIAKLVDFGIAKATNRSSGLTEDGEVKGKFAYMAPEQVRGEAVDRRADIFAIGILLYLATTGRHPYKGLNPAQTIHRICATAPPLAPSSWISSYPSALQAIVLRALQRDPGKRYASAHELFEALARAVPQAFEVGFDAEVARYLGELLGERGTERRGALRIAQQKLDSARQEGGTATGAASTLRALSLDSGNHELKAPSDGTGGRNTLLSARPGELLLEAPGRLRGRLKLLAVVAGVFALGGLIAPRLSSFGSGSAPAASALGAPLQHASVVPVADPSRPIQPEADSAGVAVDRDLASPPNAEPIASSPRKPRRALYRPPAPSKPGAPKPEAAAEARPTSPSSAPATPPSGVTQGKPNAWDPKTFGGRN